MTKLIKHVYSWLSIALLFLGIVAVYLYEFRLGFNLFALGWLLLVLRGVKI